MKVNFLLDYSSVTTLQSGNRINHDIKYLYSWQSKVRYHYHCAVCTERNIIEKEHQPQPLRFLENHNAENHFLQHPNELLWMCHPMVMWFHQGILICINPNHGNNRQHANTTNRITITNSSMSQASKQRKRMVYNQYILR